MENISLVKLIKKALDYYDNQNNKYKDLITSIDVKFTTDEYNNNIVIYNETNNTIFNSQYEMLGTFYPESKIWIWSWVFPSIQQLLNNISSMLLEYGLKIDTNTDNKDEFIFIKSLLVNSRILIEDDIQLDINLAIYSYLIKDKLKFIYPRIKYLDEKNKKYIIVYYLIK